MYSNYAGIVDNGDNNAQFWILGKLQYFETATMISMIMIMGLIFNTITIIKLMLLIIIDNDAMMLRVLLTRKCFKKH
jgi:hypothetical protein